MNVSEFVLKATPPRNPRALERQRLQAAWQHQGRAALLLTAPAGFGKTTLLLQWRRWWSDAGTPVAWVSTGEGDHPARFIAVVPDPDNPFTRARSGEVGRGVS